MATFNLLDGSFNGSLGAVYGAKWKDKAVLKTKPFGKAPPTEKQTNAVRSFEKVVRVSSVFAKRFWPYLGLSSKKMLKHNAVAQWLKPMLAGGVFSPGEFIDVVKFDPNFEMTQATQAAPGQAIQVKFTFPSGAPLPANAKMHLVAVDETGRCGVPKSLDVTADVVSLLPPVPQETPVWVLGFFNQVKSGKNFVFGGNALEANGMQYSLEEQETGDFWFDGKPIFQISVTGTATLAPNVRTTLTFPLKAEHMDRASFWFQSWAGGISLAPFNTVPAQYPTNITISDLEISIPAGNVTFYVLSPNSVPSAKYYGTFRYTKL